MTGHGAISNREMRLSMTWLRLIWSRIDRFLAAILFTVALSCVMPARGEAAVGVGWLTDAAIALLFFMHGARLSPQAALLGLRQWRLHTLVFLGTFALFPLLGISAHALAPNLLPASMWPGLLLLTALPSTVQASIAFTSVAGGNVPAALCSASASNLFGIFLTPVIAGYLLASHGLGLSLHSLLAIIEQLLLPFAAGQLLRPWLGTFITRNARALKIVDYGSILLIVYSAFSHGVVNGIWHQVDAAQLVQLAFVNAALLGAVITILTFTSRWLGFSRADEITIVFCGSKKSLASGLPMANVLFAGHVGLGIIPVMLFHQIQLMVCASLARRYAARGAKTTAAVEQSVRSSDGRLVGVPELAEQK
jgi:solute carrier family 10 (sodium/bile acid cotransporter), member 7